jgi:pimeloyl-ACP methyl ester carboxylesterase
MARTSSARNRGAASRRNRGLKVLLAVLLGLAALLVLNIFVLNNETDSAAVNVTNGQLVNTTSGQLQVVDTPPVPALGGSQTGPRPGVVSEAIPLAPPVVLIHGSGGAIDWWEELTPLLAEQGRRVIAIDMLGYGGSDKPSSGYSIESQASLVAQVLAKLDVEKAAVVGHSLGGKVATALAEGSPDLVAGLAIIDSAPDSSFGKLSGGAKAARLPVIGEALWRIAPDFMVRRNLEQAFAPGFEVPEEFVDDVRAMTYPAYRDSAEESEAYADEKPLDQRLQDLGLPLLVIFGEQDQIFPARESLSAYAAIPGVVTVLIPEAGHSPNVETPEKTAAILGRFVNSLAPEPEKVPMPPGETQGNGGQGQSGNQNQKGNQPGGGQKKTGQGSNNAGQSGEGQNGGGSNADKSGSGGPQQNGNGKRGQGQNGNSG